MALKIYNTLHRQKEDFVPMENGKVKMYVCGPTVYNFLHVGNFRGPVVYNMVRNWLEHLGYEVTYALNFTDVDDKIIDRANKENVSATEISEKYIREYVQDFNSLGLRAHHQNPKVTEYMSQIIEMISELIAKGKAYAVAGDVYFNVSAFPEYGKLSGRITEELLPGARVEVDQKKKNSTDFALWKAAKAGEPSWSSPWGEGRPGWHIECSAMVKSIFGDQIDIHGGGSDLMFPHHENEIAQSEGCSGKHFVKYWMHTSMLNLSGQKMSKSVGNIVSLREFIQTQPAEVYKWMILSSHYRTVSDFGDEAIERAIKSLAKIYSSMSIAESYLSEEFRGMKVTEKKQYLASAEKDPGFEKISSEIWNKISEALNDDFNTPEAIAAVFEILKLFNSQLKWGMKTQPALVNKSVSFLNLILKFGNILSLFEQGPERFLLQLDEMLLKKMNLTRTQVDEIVLKRTAAREQKDFAKSDEYRDQLLQMGIQLMDSSLGTRWEVSK